eukprot:m.423988 g.423988  ORF g.423988 m.423988 type:complete len:159 (+) comp56668_c0_seq8:116-592(+)
MATADIDFMALGKHCNVPGCHQLDFLPITCTLCKLVTCSFHGTNHGCVNSEIKDRRVPICPLCNKLVQTPPAGVSLNDQMEVHIASGCTRALAAPPKPKRICNVKSCKARDQIAIQCSHCDKKFCVSHRLQELHECPVAAPSKAAVLPTKSALFPRRT